MRKRLKVLGIGLLLSCQCALAIEYDHLGNDSEGKSYNLNLSVSEYVDLNVKNTCENTKISWRGVKGDKAVNDLPIDDALQRGLVLHKANTASCEFIDASVDNALNMYTNANDVCVLVEKKSVVIPNQQGFTGFAVDIDVPGTGKTVKGVSKAELAELKTSLTKSANEKCSSILTKLMNTSAARIKSGEQIVDGDLNAKLDQLKVTIDKQITSELKKFRPTVLSDTILIINTGAKGWVTDFSGGILVSDLTSKRFRVESAESQVKFVRSRAAENKQRLVLGAFTHVYHADWMNSVFKTGTPAITAGIGVNKSDTLDYFVGVSVKFGSAYLNIGSHWGQVATGPTNYPINAALTLDEAAALSALEASNDQTRTEQGLFVSVSFTFGGQGESPFKSVLAFPE